MEFYNTFKTQIELLPRLTIIYGKGQTERIVFEDDTGKLTLEETEIIHNGFAIEWLWFGVFVIL